MVESMQTSRVPIIPSNNLAAWDQEYGQGTATCVYNRHLSTGSVSTSMQPPVTPPYRTSKSGGGISGAGTI